MRKLFSSPKAIRKRRRRSVGRAVLFVFAVIGLIFGPSLLTKNPHLLIRELSLTGAAIVPENEILSRVEKELAGDWAGLYAKANIALYPQNAIRRTLLSEFPRLADVRLELDNFRGLAIEVSERIPKALWCKADECFFVDESGFVFDKAPQFTSDVYFTYETELLGNPIGQFVLSPDELTGARTFIEGLAFLDLSARSVAVAEGDATIALSDKTKIIFELSSDPSRALSNLESVLTDPKLSLRDGDHINVSVIDLRFGNKVFYK